MIYRRTLGQFETLIAQLQARVQSHVADLLKQRQILVDLESRLSTMLAKYSTSSDMLKQLQAVYGKLIALKQKQDALENTVRTISGQISTGTTPSLSATYEITKLSFDINTQMANIARLDSEVNQYESGIPPTPETVPHFLVNAFILGSITLLISYFAGQKRIV